MSRKENTAATADGDTTSAANADDDTISTANDADASTGDGDGDTTSTGGGDGDTVSIGGGDDDTISAANDADTSAGDGDGDTASTDDDLTKLPPDKLIAMLQQTQTEHSQARDDLLRARAEVENIRRRSQNEIVSARKFAIEGFARELLGVRDNLERAAAVAIDEDAAPPVGQMKEGIGLTLKQFDLALSRFAVVEVEAAPGARFDPECHQAISMAVSDEVEADHIVSVVQKGFLLKERLLRPAMVVVAQQT